MVSLHSDTGTSFSQVEAWSVLLVCRGLWGAANLQRQQKGLGFCIDFYSMEAPVSFQEKIELSSSRPFDNVLSKTR